MAAKRLNKRLRQTKSVSAAIKRDTSGLLKNHCLATSDTLDVWLRKLPGIYRLHAYILQSGLAWSVSFLCLV